MVAAVGWSQQDADAQGIEYLAAAETIQLVSDNRAKCRRARADFFKGDGGSSNLAFTWVSGRRRSRLSHCELRSDRH